VGHPLLAWIVILVVVSLVVFAGMRRRDSGEGGHQQSGLTLVHLQGKLLVGAASFPGSDKQDLLEQLSTINAGPYSHRLRYVVLAGELAGPTRALQVLDQTEQLLEESTYTPSDEQRKTARLLRETYTGYEEKQWGAPSLSPADRQFLEEELGWFGSLALLPEEGPDKVAREALIGSAANSVMLLGVLTLCGLMALIVGLGILVLLTVLFYFRRMESHMSPPAVYGGVYAETFALWLVVFIAMSMLSGLVPDQDTRIAVSCFTMPFSLVVLWWPMCRGVTWNEVRRDVGWSGSRQPWAEPFRGVISYLAGLPLMFLGVLLTTALVQLTASPAGIDAVDPLAPLDTPTHPILGWLADASWLVRLQILFLACVVAPVVEETMFRGVLYRHLRNATRAWRVGLSIALAALVNSLIFAAIHPQGLVAIPVLATIGLILTFARQWRGTLWASMTAHALNNGVVTLLLFVIL
jgi:membrane protease YdiL (CAAX protease family)